MFDNLKEIYKGILIFEEDTIYLYLFIIFSTVFLAAIGYRYRHKFKSNIFSNPFFISSFLIFALFLVLRDVGTDLPMYRLLYNNCDLDSSFFNNQELGFVTINKILKWFDLSDNFVIGIFGFVTVLLYYLSIQQNAKEINIPMSIFAYGCMYYFQSYNLIRMYLASAILIFASKYLIKGETKKYSLIVFATIFIHYSAILVYIPLVFYIIYKKKYSYFIATYILAFLIGTVLLNYLSSIPLFARYDQYISGGMMKSGIGFFQFVINIPLFLLYLYCKRRFNGVMLDVFLIYTLSALLIGIFSYKVMMIGRSLVYYNIVFMLCIQYFIKQLKKLKDKNYIIICSAFYAYFYWRFYQYLSEYLYFDQIMPYKFLDGII